MADIPNLGCTVTPTEEYRLEDKQNVNIVIVPETIFLAFRESAGEVSEKNVDYLASTEEGAVAAQLDSIYVNEPGSTVTDVGIVPLTQNEDVNLHDQYVKIQPAPFKSDSGISHTNNSHKTSQGSLLFVKNAGFKISTTQREIESLSAAANGNTSPESLVVTNDFCSLTTGTAARDEEAIRSAARIVLSSAGVVIKKRKSGDDNNEPTVLQYKCTVFNCGKTFNTYLELEKHRKGHGDLKMYRCPRPDCPWSFKTRYKLTRHMRSHDQSKQFKCKFVGCMVECSTEYNLKKHLEMHTKKQLTCEQCDLNFPNQHKKQKHLRQVHRVAPRFRCPNAGCDKVLSTGSAFRHHVNSHKNPTSAIVCAYGDCGKKFHRPSTYRDHVLCQHTNIRPYKCNFPQCDKAFSSGIKLRRHQVIHNPVGRLSCPQENCKSTFHRMEHLKLHLKTHSKDGKGGTNVLEPVESSDDNLVYYFCPYEECGSLFATFIGAKQHICKVHGSLPKAKVNSSKSADDDTGAKGPQPIPSVAKSSGESETQSNGTEKISVIVTEDLQSEETESKNNHSEDACNLPNLLTTAITADSSTQNASSQTPQCCFQTFGQDVNFGQQETTQPYPSVSSPEDSSLDTLPVYELSSPLHTRLEPSQFFLDATADLVPTSSAVSPNLAGRDAIDYVTISPSAAYNAARAADRFLNFSDCVQTVNPNMVMSEPRSCSVDDEQCSSGVTHDFEDNNNTDEDDELNHGGSARTDCDAYRRVSLGKKTKNFSKVSLFASPGCNIGPTFNNIMHGLDLPQVPESDPCTLQRVSQFLRDPDQERQSSDDSFKNSDIINLPGQDFSRSTINLSDLA